jgi:hypothetical protein
MAQLRAKYVPDIENMPQQEILETLMAVEKNGLECLNWGEFPYKPEVGFHLAYSNNALAVLWEVKEDHVRAVSLEDNGPVWEDSCVEFFVSDPNGSGYFNFEMNCIGTVLAAKRTSRTDAQHFGPETMSRIRNFGSLAHQIVDCQKADQEWWRVIMIPFSVIGLEGAPASLNCNFYKCGDNCARKHFLSWAPIEAPAPNFHCPEFFAEVILDS